MSRTDLEAEYPTLMRAQLVALRAYAEAHGRDWKAQLRAEWMNATAPPLLHHLRNTHGPAWLAGFHLVEHAPQRGELRP